MFEIKDINELGTRKESLYFDRKSSRIDPGDIVRHIIGFANANGGCLAIGIENNGEIIGFNHRNSHTIQEYKTVILRSCIPVPDVSYVEMSYGEGLKDFVLLINVEQSSNQVIRDNYEKVYLRSNDSTIELTHSQITALEYDKGQRLYEDQIVEDATMEDIDLDIVEDYQKVMNVEGKKPEDILKARNLMRNGKLTVAAILLFGNNPTKFFPSARIRFLRYDGKKALYGTRINIVKDVTFDYAIPVAIEKVQTLVNSQLRDFQMLMPDGKFKVIPEYPEFAWLEGLVNAVNHRNYNITGDYIRITMFDDRLEIHSPGKLPNIVTLENMKNTRFSRNARISRFLAEFGWVKELNEGVNRIYDEMQRFYLKEPTYSEPNNNSVLLVLENSITSRHLRAGDQLSQKFLKDVWSTLNTNEQFLMHYAYSNSKITTKEACSLLGVTSVTARKLLKTLAAKGLLVWLGTSEKDPRQCYVFNCPTTKDAIE
jgi:ATP-dependent DNA helicase RecG